LSISNMTSRRKPADFHLVSKHERVCETDSGGKADDGSNDYWCGFPRTTKVARHQLAQSSP
jgi:hypothetical protein